MLDLEEIKDGDLYWTLLDLVVNHKDLKAIQESLEKERDKLEKLVYKNKEKLIKSENIIKNKLLGEEGNKFKHPVHGATLCKEQIKLSITDESCIDPKHFKKVLNKSSLNDEFKETGAIPDGCSIETYRKLIIK